MWFVFALQTLKPEAVTSLGKLRLCLNHSKVRETIMILNNAATAAAAGGDAVAVADGDDNFYNILTYYINQKIK